jgi:glycosyltransferase involved in cell wall biosynthesis
MSEVRASVIITSYNQCKYLVEAIESVIAQTHRPHEIVIADDGSKGDGSVELIEQYVARYPGWVRGVYHRVNVGIPRNRNAALALVTGEFVTVLDGDDRFLPDNLKTQLSVLLRSMPSACSYSNHYRVTPEGVRVATRYATTQPSGDLLGDIAAGRMGILRTLIAPTALVRAVGGFDAAFPHHDGFVLTLRLAKLAQFVYVPEPLMEKRQHAEGTSRGISAQERLGWFERLHDEVRRVVCDVDPSRAAAIEQAWIGRLAQQHKRINGENVRTTPQS